MAELWAACPKGVCISVNIAGPKGANTTDANIKLIGKANQWEWERLTPFLKSDMQINIDMNFNSSMPRKIICNHMRISYKCIYIYNTYPRHL